MLGPNRRRRVCFPLQSAVATSWPACRFRYNSAINSLDPLSPTLYKVVNTEDAPAIRNARARFAIPSWPKEGPAPVLHADNTTSFAAIGKMRTRSRAREHAVGSASTLRPLNFRVVAQRLKRPESAGRFGHALKSRRVAKRRIPGWRRTNRSAAPFQRAFSGTTEIRRPHWGHML
jgi:hypothetical protein